MRCLRARYERATGKTAKGHEFHAWVLADEPQTFSIGRPSR